MLHKIKIHFADSINSGSSNYLGPQSKIEKFLVRIILNFCLNSNPKIVVHFEHDSSFDSYVDNVFHLAPPRLWAAFKILIDPEFQIGETYINGNWYLKNGDLTNFIAEVFSYRKSAYLRYYNYTKKLASMPFFFRQYVWTKKTTRKSADHYDLESSVYRQILDDEFLYTCAFFDEANQTLESAQIVKMEKINQRLRLHQGTKEYLDIGCGWGSLLRYAVKNNENVNATGISISQGQISHAIIIDSNKLIKNEADRIDYQLEDYMDHQAKNEGYDAISVVGMMEHVGLPHHAKFLKVIEQLLKPGGRALIHTIICPKEFKASNRWVDKYIFPGGYAPSNNEVKAAINQTTLKIDEHYIHEGKNYKRTMQEWKENFLKNYLEIGKRIALSKTSSAEVDRELRIWYFYLSSLQNMFDDKLLGYHIEHFVLEKPFD